MHQTCIPNFETKVIERITWIKTPRQEPPFDVWVLGVWQDGLRGLVKRATAGNVVSWIVIDAITGEIRSATRPDLWAELESPYDLEARRSTPSR